MPNRETQVKLRVGQRWSYGLGEHDCIYLDIIAIQPDGEVQLRAIDETNLQKYKEAFPDVPFTKGNPSNAPFKQVDARTAKSNKELAEGDLLAHQAWSCWDHMLSGEIFSS